MSTTKPIVFVASTDEIKGHLKNAGNDVAFVNFFSPTCGPCRLLEPILEELANNGAINLIRVNVNDYPEIAQEWQVNAWPTNFIFKANQQIDKITGFQPKEEWEKRLNQI